MKVLVVEDEPALAFRLQKALETSSFVVDIAYDGEEGHHLGEIEPYDAIVLDLGLPELTGSWCCSNGVPRDYLRRCYC